MDIETAVIEKLAEQLGTTADKLWVVLVTQAPISGATNLLVCAIFISMTAVIFFALRYIQKKADWMDDDLAPLYWLPWLTLAIFTLVLICVEAESIVAALLNPEYWALEKILQVVK